jgi:putative FmdB family regulatory protein
MPAYDYRCEDCQFLQEEEARMSEYKALTPKCKECGGKCRYEFTPTVIQFALKDGPSGSWPSKGNRFKNYRAKRSEEMGRRQRDRYGHLNRDALPNYKGQLTEDWREARDLAMKDKDSHEARGTDSLAVAATFNPAINKEKAKNRSKVSSKPKGKRKAS